MSQRSRQATANNEHAVKLRLEKPLAVQMRQILRQMARDLGAVYAATGRVIDARQYRDEIIGILQVHYRKTMRIFGGTLTAQIRSEVKEIETPSIILDIFDLAGERNGTSAKNEVAKYEAQKDAAIQEYTSATVPQRADLITETNQKELNRAVAAAAASVEDADPVAIGNAARRNFEDSALYRGALIATTEIQTAAEAAKLIENVTFQNTTRPLIEAGWLVMESLKEWHTMGDEKVRPAHRAADLQDQPFESPFNVGGELMMYPADTSLGATAGNTINCRCTAVYWHQGEIIRVRSAA